MELLSPLQNDLTKWRRVEIVLWDIEQWSGDGGVDVRCARLPNRQKVSGQRLVDPSRQAGGVEPATVFRMQTITYRGLAVLSSLLHRHDVATPHCFPASVSLALELKQLARIDFRLHQHPQLA